MRFRRESRHETAPTKGWQLTAGAMLASRDAKTGRPALKASVGTRGFRSCSGKATATSAEQ